MSSCSDVIADGRSHSGDELSSRQAGCTRCSTTPRRRMRMRPSDSQRRRHRQQQTHDSPRPQQPPHPPLLAPTTLRMSSHQPLRSASHLRPEPLRLSAAERRCCRRSPRRCPRCSPPRRPSPPACSTPHWTTARQPRRHQRLPRPPPQRRWPPRPAHLLLPHLPLSTVRRSRRCRPPLRYCRRCHPTVRVGSGEPVAAQPPL